MNIVDLSIKRPIMVSMGLIALVLFGLFAYFQLPLSLLPDTSPPYVTVQTVYAGASPSVIETQITKKIEDQVSAISQLDTIESYSLDSVSIVAIAFKYGKDENLALQEVKDKVEAINSELPSDAKKPVISKINGTSEIPVMSIILDGDMSPSEMYTFATDTVSNRLSQVAGVGSIKVSGGAEREIHVDINRATVFERQVPVAQIAGLIATANLDMPGGNFTYANRDIPVQLKGRFTDLGQLKDLDVPTAAGTFKLRQLASVHDTNKTVRARTVLFDKNAGTRNDNAILLQVIKNPSGNTVKVVEGIQKQISAVEALGNGHVHLKVISEDRTYVKDTVNDTLSNVYMGILLTGLVLLLFLHDWRSTVIVALAMPFSIIATFLIMQAMGIGLNLMSLTGLSSATGTLVANSVVVLENIFKYKNQGLGRVEAASKGTKEVIVAVFASTLTNIAVFVPLGSISGRMGPVLAQFAYTTVISTVFSIIVSFTLTPLMASRILPDTPRAPGKIGIAIENVLKTVSDAYGKTLAAAVRTKRRSIAVVVSSIVLLVVSLCFGKFIGFEMMPSTDGGKIQINVEMPQGSSLDETARMFKTIEDRLSQHKEVTMVESILGSIGESDQDVSMGQMYIYLVPVDKRSRSNKVIAVEYTRELSDIAGPKISVSPVSELSFSGVSFGLDLFLKGDDSALLQQYADQIKDTLNKVPGISNVALSSKSGKQELDFVPDRKVLSQDGLTVQDIAITLRAAMDGVVTTKYKENNKEYDIRVSIAGGSLTDINDIRNIPVVSRAGTYPLSRYAAVSFENSTNKIIRVNKIRTIEITADPLPGYSIGTLQTAALNAVGKLNLPAGYTVETAGMSKLMGDTVRDLVMVFVIAVILIYMLLAATLEDLTQPLLILATVPLSIVGVIFGCVMTGAVLNIVAMLGVIMLVGIVVNNAILILDTYNTLRRSGMENGKALLEACSSKLKAVLMSNIAIILGMVPMALGMGASGAEMRQPMGIVIIGGIISSTVLTMYVIPAMVSLQNSSAGRQVKQEK